MRLFVGIWPSPELRALLSALPRPQHRSVRWTTDEQWHVTLRFLGEVADDDLPDLEAALAGAARAQPPGRAEAGPATTVLGSTSLVVPVAGVDGLAAAVTDATRAAGQPPGGRPFRGHLTLARSRGGRAFPGALAGRPLAGSWPVEEVALVRSHLEPAGARYRTRCSFALGTGARLARPEAEA